MIVRPYARSHPFHGSGNISSCPIAFLKHQNEENEFLWFMFTMTRTDARQFSLLSLSLSLSNTHTHTHTHTHTQTPHRERMYFRGLYGCVVWGAAVSSSLDQMGGPHATLLPRTTEGCTANMIRREMKTGRLLNTAFRGCAARAVQIWKLCYVYLLFCLFVCTCFMWLLADQDRCL
jgi:hypothetical protein